MAIRTDVIAVSVPKLRAARLSVDARYTGVKETYAIARVEAGHAEWWCRGRLWRSEPGSLLIMQPGDVHRDVTRVGTLTFQMVALPALDVEPVLGKRRIQPQLPAEDARGAAFQYLHDAVRAGADRLALEVAIVEAIHALAGVGDLACNHTRPVRRALELLRAQLAEAVTLDTLATHAGLDKFHLCRAFRAQVGLPPHAYLTQLRVLRAKQLLTTGARPSDVAAQVGFYDQSQLHRHFRRIVGTTPGEYARRG